MHSSAKLRSGINEDHTGQPPYMTDEQCVQLTPTSGKGLMSDRRHFRTCQRTSQPITKGHMFM
eukprot:46180-Eustigmatos_ZCMA.PRE.1